MAARYGIPLSFALATASFPTPSHAQTANDGLALETFEEGRRLFEAHAYDDALRAFQASFDAMPSPNSRLYVARCLREKGLFASAYSAFRVASREAEDRVRATGDRRYAATQKSAALEADRLESLVPRVRLVLEPGTGTKLQDIDRAVVNLDGTSLPRARMGVPIELDPGTHVIAISGSHVRRGETRISVAAGDTKTVTLAIERAPFGSIQVILSAIPRGLAAELDGEPIDVSRAAQTREVAVGTHRISARAPGYASLQWEGAVADEATVDVVVDLTPAPLGPSRALLGTARDGQASGTPKWLFFATAGVAVATTGAGAILLADARSREQDEEAKPASARDPATRDDVRSRAELSSVLFVSAAAFAVAATVFAFTTRWRPNGAATAVARRAPFDGAWLRGEF